MNHSRRNEPLRYSFSPEMPCSIQLYEINNCQLDSNQGKAYILDLSSNGCKLESQLNFKVKYNECKIILTLKLTQNVELRGTIIWQDTRPHAHRYGIRIEPAYQKLITEELKAYSKMQKQGSSEA
ncbi:PilZ domain-containing protein [Paenibacillus eucommiae]|uniref:PilZ domain-containing protein n=1 Tax=Paenibacillus eucommiae TaxID=1355755 RepID=A0ABS4IYE3_9BACL|nr:PilZ domain-containing protein [Paenibacillus eucommiae]MBP1991559.1 hypothetical protein [Paenibacillus eucommiae]